MSTIINGQNCVILSEKGVNGHINFLGMETDGETHTLCGGLKISSTNKVEIKEYSAFSIDGLTDQEIGQRVRKALETQRLDREKREKYHNQDLKQEITTK